MDVQPAHRSRRSFPNLQHLSLAPLSSRFPIDGDDFEAEPDSANDRIRISYIQGKSAPTTPSILSESRSSSRPRNGKTSKRRHAHATDHYFSPDLEISDIQIPKAKSAVGLDSAGGMKMHHVRRATGETLSPMHTRHVPRPMLAQTDDEWLHRAGMIMSAEARENKGQAWLVSRDSSTSLVAHTLSGEHLDEDDQHIMSPHYSHMHSRVASRTVSRVASRAPSARTSRRGSMVGGSRLGFMTPMDAKTPGSVMGGAEGYFDDVEAMAEPDFVEAEDDGALDDEEISRLSKQKGFGFSGLVDRLVGFSLFNVEEDAEETEDDDAEMSNEEAIKKRQAELKKKREELARAAKHSAEALQRGEHVQPANEEGEGRWQDAAWLLSVASKVLY